MNPLGHILRRLTAPRSIFQQVIYLLIALALGFAPLLEAQASIVDHSESAVSIECSLERHVDSHAQIDHEIDEDECHLSNCSNAALLETMCSVVVRANFTALSLSMAVDIWADPKLRRHLRPPIMAAGA